MDIFQFPRQRVLCDEKPFSRELLLVLLGKVYSSSPPFTGYLQIIGDGSSLDFLFFYNGAPYTAGRYINGMPINYSILEFGEHLASSADKAISVTLSETDPVLLKSMLLFLKKEPEVKAPTTLIDLESIVQQIGEAGVHAMIALYLNNKVNFFFFREGKAAYVYYSDFAFERPEGMTVDEEMRLYAFQPGEKVLAFIYRDIVPTKAEASNQLDKNSLYKLLTCGIPKNRRREDARVSPMPEMEEIKVTVNDLPQKAMVSSYVLFVESGPLKGESFTVTLPCTIGRINCDLTLDDNHISRRHAELKIVENKLIIEDLTSKNGIKVNGNKVTKWRLNANDLISIGKTKLRISTA